MLPPSYYVIATAGNRQRTCIQNIRKNEKSSVTEGVGEALVAILKNLSPEPLAALVSAAREQWLLASC